VQVLSHLETEHLLLEQTYRTVLVAYARQCKLAEAEKILERMKYHGVQPTVHTYTALMSAMVEYVLCGLGARCP
jgi:pentatricopeptide repeat protein